MLPFAEENMLIIWHFQQDCDPKHTSKAVKEWFTTNNVKVLEWPPQSPDLNPIENLWRQLKLKISGQNPKNRNELWMMLQEAWYSIPVEVCRKLVDSMPSRCTEVLKKKRVCNKMLIICNPIDFHLHFLFYTYYFARCGIYSFKNKIYYIYLIT